MTETKTMPRLSARVRLHRGAIGKAELVGFADLLIDEHFVINGIRILKAPAQDGRPEGLFLGFPSRKEDKDGEARFFEHAHPITAAARRAALETVLAAYEKARG